jgi:ParB family chromosome partitioning protein
MASRDDYDDFFGDDDTTPVVDTRADGRLYRVPLARLSANLVNPRTDFGTDDQLIDLGKSLARRQNQPCPVVSRGAYLKLWPDHDSRLGDVDYVLVSGERRYRAATAVGLPALDCVVNDDFAKDRRSFMEAVVSENVDRQNFDPIEEAYAVHALVAEFGSNRAVAQHFERVDGWVTQRVLLTHLAREVQDLVRTKAIPLEAARSLGKQARDNAWDAAQQLAWWEQEQDRRAAAAAARKAAKKTAATPQSQPAAVSPAEPSFTAVKQEPAPKAVAEVPELAGEERPAAPALQPTPAPQVSTAVSEPAVVVAEERTDSIPEPREAVSGETEGDSSEGRKLPYRDPSYITMHLARKMTDRDFLKMVELCVWTANERDPEALRRALATVLAPQSD